MLYYDPFDIQEEEDFVHSQQIEVRRRISSIISSLQCFVPGDHNDKDTNTLATSPLASSPNNVMDSFPSRIASSKPINNNTTTTATTTTTTTTPQQHMTKIHLDLPIELESLQALVTCLQKSYVASSSSSSTHDHSCLKELSFSQWGLGDVGVQALLQLLQQRKEWHMDKNQMMNKSPTTITKLSLTSCGITKSGLDAILESMAARSVSDSIPSSLPSLPSLPSSSSSSSLQSFTHSTIGQHIVELDISRNNLKASSLNETTTQFCPFLAQCHSLQVLRLSSTGLTEEWWKQILETYTSRSNHSSSSGSSSIGTTSSSYYYCCRRLRLLDISYNFDSLAPPLQVLVQHLESLQKENLDRRSCGGGSSTLQIHSLLLAKGASSSACLDYTTETCDLLKGLSQSLPFPNSTIQAIGAISLLPLDRHTHETSSLRESHAQCRAELETLQCYTILKNRLHYRFLQNMLAQLSSSCDHDPHDATTLSVMEKTLVGDDPIAVLHLVLESLERRTDNGHSKSLLYWILQETCAQWA